MKIVDKIPYFIIAGFIYLLIYTSCANEGSPVGGPKDTIPPVLIRSQPEYGALNFKGNEIRLTFDEYIVDDKASETMVISPPMKKRPTLRLKSKTLILQFNEKLRDSVTYSIDFKNSIEDNNERNPMKSLRFSFSTWGVLDTLRVAGMVKDAKTLEPVAKSLVMLYRNLSDTAIYSMIPDYIDKTDEKGLFLFDNIAPGKYHLFAINDVNSDLKYSPGAEAIAYDDSLIVPEVHFHAHADTLVSGTDSLLILGHYHFLPGPVYLRQFIENIFNQFLTSSERETRYKCRFIFEQSVKDTFGINLLNYKASNWYMLEPNPTMDTITLWISDTTVANLDTLRMKLSYNQVDSTGSFYIKNDTLDMSYLEKNPEPVRRKRKGNEEAPPAITQFIIGTNIKTNAFDLNNSIYLTIPQPVKYFNPDMIHLSIESDTTHTPLKFTFRKDTTAWRRYKLSYSWYPNTSYRLKIDSAACENIYGITNSKFLKVFKTQKEDYYGSIIIHATNVPEHVIIQLLSADKEAVVQNHAINKDGDVTFSYLAPEKYKLKVIYDSNGNGKWDTGSLKKHYQPEVVGYFQKVIKVRSNWVQKEPWDLTIDPTYPKNIYDKDLEEQKKKEATEKGRNTNSQNRNRGVPANLRRVP